MDGKAKLVAERYCDGLGACLGECPRGALRIVEREAEEFDEEAVEEHLKSGAQVQILLGVNLACGCPSTRVQSFTSTTPCEEANEPVAYTGTASALSHWPVQIRLVPPNAVFLKGAVLLVAADCVPVAYPRFHQDFLGGKVVMVGCPKFDDVQAYVQRFTDIFNVADVKGIVIVVMEVPCCQGLPVIIKKGMELAGKRVPMEQIVISTRGEILERERLVA